MRAKQLPSGNYRVRVDLGRDAQGKRIIKSITAPTRKEAEYAAMAMKLDRQIMTESTIQKALSDYIADRTAVLSPSTIRSYRTLERSAYDTIRHIRIADFDSMLLQKWVNAFSKDHSPKTVRNAYGLLLSAVKYAEPSANIYARLPQKTITERNIPTDKDVKQLLSAASPNMRISIMLAAIGTLRRGEICALTYEDIKGNTIHVHSDIVRSESGEWVLKNMPKTSSSDRYIELPDEVIKELGTGTGRIITVTPNALTQGFMYLCKRLGMSFRFHDLRHYAASIMHAIGIPDVYIMERGGWKSDAVLKSVYRNVLNDKRHEFSDKANAYAKNLL